MILATKNVVCWEGVCWNFELSSGVSCVTLICDNSEWKSTRNLDNRDNRVRVPVRSLCRLMGLLKIPI